MKKYLKQIRKLRNKIIQISYEKKSSHLGSSLSCLEILFACFLINKNKKSEILLSKGHAALAYYTVLEEFTNEVQANNFLEKGTNLWGHITKSKNSEYLKFGFGSLGYGLGIAAGMAYSNRKRVVLVISSDGELNEGSFWESLMFLHHHNLSNICLLIDNNKIQSLDFCKNVIDFGDLKKLFKPFNFLVLETNGHNVQKIFKLIQKKSRLPKIIICDTIKGKGIKRIENKIESHYKPAVKSDIFK